MIRRLINRLQGKTWLAMCDSCTWNSGRGDLTRQQAENRAKLHGTTSHPSRVNQAARSAAKHAVSSAEWSTVTAEKLHKIWKELEITKKSF